MNLEQAKIHYGQHHDPYQILPVWVKNIMITVNDEYVKLLVAQPEGASGGPEGTRRNEQG